MKSIYKVHKIKMVLGLFVIAYSTSTCKKLVEIDGPFTSTNSSNVYTSDATAAAVLTGIYAKMSNQDVANYNNDITGISIFAALSADELTLFNVNDITYSPFYINDIPTTTGIAFWNRIYSYIFIANSAIEGLSNSSGLTPAIKQQLLGEAKFIRAFCYFYLVNLYGDVPLTTGTDYKINSLLARAPKAQVYQQLVGDLIDAQAFLSSNYLKSDAFSAYLIGSAERVRPTKWAATALLARAYLYMGDPVNAEVQATSVINNATFYSLGSLNTTFLKNSSETIWSLQPVGVGTRANTGAGALFILPASGPNTSLNGIYLSNNVVGNFELNDQRKTNWVGSDTVGSTIYYYPYKYKIGSVNTTTQEYIMILRLAEQYLVRAEARAQQNNLSGAQTDLNVVRSRAGLPGTIANDKASMLKEILHERQVELFTEWGHRWFDLKRTSNIDAVMITKCPLKGGTWASYKALYPIQNTEIAADPNLVQNTGY